MRAGWLSLTESNLLLRRRLALVHLADTGRVHAVLCATRSDRGHRVRVLLHGLVESLQIWGTSDEGKELGQVRVLV